MPFRPDGTFQRAMNWQNDAAADIPILADRHDTEDDNFANGLSETITKSGKSQPTADIPMNGKRLINLGEPVAATDAATKQYADTIRAFTTAITLSGNAAQARIKFTGGTGPWGFEFPAADVSFGVKAGVSGTSYDRFVWNEKDDLSGQDIMTLNAGDTAQLGVGVSPPIFGASGFFGSIFSADSSFTINAYLHKEGAKWCFTNPGFAYLITADRAAGTFAIYRSSVAGTAGDVSTLVAIVWQNRLTLAADGQVTVPNQINAAGAILQTNGNVIGSVWAQYGTGHSNAYEAVYYRIETRCTDYRNTTFTQSRSAGYVGFNGSGGAGAYFEFSGYFLSGVQKVSGDSYNMYFRQPQLYTANTGWVTAFPW